MLVVAKSGGMENGGIESSHVSIWLAAKGLLRSGVCDMSCLPNGVLGYTPVADRGGENKQKPGTTEAGTS